METPQPNYRLRSYNHKNLWDVELVNLMRFHPEVMKAKGYWKRGFKYDGKVDLQEVDYDANHTVKISRKLRDIFFVVADTADRVAGWIWFYRDKTYPLPLAVRKFYGLTVRNSRIYQISYEKLMSDGWPVKLMEKVKHVDKNYLGQERKGVIVTGLAQAIERTARSYHKLYVHKHKLVFYAFTHPSNVPSRIVLTRNGFERLKRKYSYAGIPNYLWVKIV